MPVHEGQVDGQEVGDVAGEDVADVQIDVGRVMLKFVPAEKKQVVVRRHGPERVPEATSVKASVELAWCWCMDDAVGCDVSIIFLVGDAEEEGGVEAGSVVRRELEREVAAGGRVEDGAAEELAG
jgi:hypothetical protein